MLIAAQRPDADARMIAHVLLGSLHSELILACLAADGPARPGPARRGGQGNTQRHPRCA